MFHSRIINTRINNLHFPVLRIIYTDETSSFEELLEKDGSVTIHQRTLQLLAIEMFKVTHNIVQKVVFYNASNPKKVYTGLETLRNLGPKIWDLVPHEFKSCESLSLFKDNIIKWRPCNCPCRLCKVWIPNLGFT